MFPTQTKVNRKASSRFWLVPVVALALLLLAYAGFAFSTAEAQTPAGDYCIEGIVIDWEEKPLAGWGITLTNDVVLTTISAEEPDDDDDDPDFQKGEFQFKEADGLPQNPDVYTVTIESRAGWEGVTPTTITFPIDAGNDDCVKIRFKMRPIYPVTVVKIDADHRPLEDWMIKAAPGGGNLFAEPDEEETDATGRAFFTLTPGAWIFMEMPPKPDKSEPAESFMPVVPPNGRQELNIDKDDIAPGTALTVVFKNELVVGCVAAIKRSVQDPNIPAPQPPTTSTAALTDTVPSPDDPFNAQFGVPGWMFTLERKDGTIARQGVTDATGRVEFDNLPLGPYVLVEENRAGWNQLTAGPEDVQSRKLEVNVTGNHCDDLIDGQPVEPGITEAVVFENYQDDSGYCVEGYKVDANGGYGLPGWKIKIKPLAEGGYDPADQTTDGLGYYKFEFPRNDYRVPGAKYEICEEEKDGWLPHTDTCQTVVLPEWPMGECIQLKDFVNQQVGHSESEKMWGDMSMGGPQMGGPQMGGGMDMGGQCSSYHVVKAGEGLYDIGRMYHKTPAQMLAANPDVMNNKNQWVYVGQKICIP
jgi:hypothetical protein